MALDHSLVCIATTCVLVGCACNPSTNGDSPPTPDPEKPPELVSDPSGVSGRRVGDSAEVRWTSNEPVVWEDVAVPTGWQLEAISVTAARMHGRLEVGASTRSEPATVRATSVATGLDAVNTVNIRARVRVVESAAFLELDSQSIVRRYLIDVTTDTPPWSDQSVGFVIVHTNTVGLSNPGGGGWIPDKIIVTDQEPDIFELRNDVEGQCTQADRVEDEEQFRVAGVGAQKTFADGRFEVRLADHAAPPPARCDDDDRLVSVRVQFH